MAGSVLTEQRGDVLLLTLNRPDRLNAWTSRMASELTAAIAEANESADIGAIVMTGAGRAFCAGADIEDTFAKPVSAPQPAQQADAGATGDPGAFDWVGLCARSKPLIAAVNGVCIGVGLTQILSFDMIIASGTARLGIGFIKVGVVPELGSTRLLTQRMGPGRARMFALSGDMWPAADALSAGLVDRVVPADELMEEAIGLAGRIAANPAPQLGWTKHLLTVNALEPDLDVVQEREFDVLRQCYASPEHAEAIRAFQEKRPPRFPPRSSNVGV